MAEHKAVIKNAWFRLTGGRMVARGEEVIMSAEDYARAVKSDAVVESLADLETHGELPEFPEDGDISDQASWMRSATLEDVKAAVEENPALADQLAAAELLRGSETRSDVLNMLEEVAGADPMATADSELDIDADEDDILAWVEEDSDEEVQKHRAALALAAEQAKGEDAREDLVSHLEELVGELGAPADPPAPEYDAGELDITAAMDKVMAWVDADGKDPAGRLGRAEQALAAEQARPATDQRKTLVGDLEAAIAAEKATA